MNGEIKIFSSERFGDVRTPGQVKNPYSASQMYARQLE